MPSLDVEENIKKIQEAIESTYQELHRLQGSLRVFLGFKENGLTTIDIPEKKEEEVKLQELQDADKSTQE
ncbi:hypothetical protein OlV7_058c [Ostreococcus lucimarinus virus 7]|jgi:hypothetical protein|uniref:hypothetical protein n=1 Tax=Ostreococcus lucimarinus virus 7 TaxID=1663209 RepID=UPI0006D0FB59|nr:hypothetical protein AP054_gp058 [Ostreococcus lucimarinus virus 7]ALI95690.1 hypothetical protein OlV7_058c [Ostreococcus lucimarinus virus 7]QBP06751.1 hypothetical protein OlV7_gene57 [Ostreococcus lucimarinus virus 7]